jgi:hypothetical protein
VWFVKLELTRVATFRPVESARKDLLLYLDQAPAHVKQVPTGLECSAQSVKQEQRVQGVHLPAQPVHKEQLTIKARAGVLKDQSGSGRMEQGTVLPVCRTPTN